MAWDDEVDYLALEYDYCERCGELGVARDPDGRFLCADCLFESMRRTTAIYEDDEMAVEAAADRELERYHALCEAHTEGEMLSVKLRHAIMDIQKVIRDATGDAEFQIVLDSFAFSKIHAKIVEEIKPIRSITPGPMIFEGVEVTWRE